MTGHGSVTVELRAMRPSDLAQVGEWLCLPHVSRWWLPESTLETEIGKLSQRLAAHPHATVRLLIVERRDPPDRVAPEAIGWCQWYPYDAFPEEALVLDAHQGDCGMDYAIGEPSALRHGLGAQMLTHLTRVIHRHHPQCGLIAAPEAANTASRRLLEQHGFRLQAVRPLPTEPHERPVAIYRHDSLIGNS